MKNETGESLEKKIYFRDLFWQVLSAWRFLLAMLLVFAVLFNVYGYVKNKGDYQVHYEQSAEELRKQLTPEEIEYVNTAVSTLAQVDSEKAYLVKSVIINLDANKLNQVTLTYQLRTGYTVNLGGVVQPSNSSELVNMYTDAIYSDAFLSDLATAIHWDRDNLYLAELLSVKSNDRLSASNSNFFENDNLSIVITGQTMEQAEAIAVSIQSQLATYHDDFAAVTGSFELTLLSHTQQVSMSKSIIDSKNSCITRVNDMEAKYTQMVAKMSQLQKDLLAKLTADTENSESTEDLITATSQPAVFNAKYVVVGAIFGLFLAAAWVCARYLFSAKIKSANELKDLYGFAYLAQLTSPASQKKTLFSGLDARIDGLRSRNQLPCDKQLPVVTSYLKATCSKNQIANVLFCAPEALDAADAGLLDQLMDGLRSDSLQAEACSDAATDPAAMEQMILSRNVVLVLRQNASSHNVLQNQLALCQRENIRILGCVLIK